MNYQPGEIGGEIGAGGDTFAARSAANYAHSAATMKTTTNRTARSRAHKPRSPHVRGKLCGQPLHRALPRPNSHTSQGDGF